jgi:hypothetical protein
MVVMCCTPLQESVKNSGISFTLLRLPMFIDNQWANQASIKGQGKIYGPADGSKPTSLVSVADAGEAAAVRACWLPTLNLAPVFRCQRWSFFLGDCAMLTMAMQGKACAH